MEIEFMLQFSTAFLLCHEMDAIKQKEWRILPILKNLNDEVGYKWFVALHFPLYVALLYGFTSSNVILSLFINLFSVIHYVLHFILRKHPLNTFNNFISQFFIAGAAIFGLLYIIWFTLFSIMYLNASL